MALESTPSSEDLERARRAARVIADDDTPDHVTRAIGAFDDLEALADARPEPGPLVHPMVCASVKFVSLGRLRGRLDLVRRAHAFLRTLAERSPRDPLPRRAFAETAVDLMLAEAKADEVDRVISTYRAVASLAAEHAGDPAFAAARAKAAANLVALALDRDRETTSDEAMDDLDALEEQFPNEQTVVLQRCRGRFNRLAWYARKGCPDKAFVELQTLADMAHQNDTSEDLIDLASDGAFVMVSQLGSRGKHAAALNAYQVLVDVIRLDGANDDARRRLADAAFNLVTDLCQSGRADDAQLIYDDLCGLSVADDQNPAIRLAQAKAAANLILTYEKQEDDAAATVLIDDLRALVLAHPDDADVFAIASFIDDES